jgi:hypothetical protein
LSAGVASGSAWTIHGEQSHRIEHFETYAFSVQLSYFGNPQAIGLQDVIDLITSSIERFAWNGRVGARGYLYCQLLSQTQDGMGGQDGIPDCYGMKWVLHALP